MHKKLNALVNLTETLKGQHVEVIFKTGDVETGILSTIKVNKTFNIAIELADEDGKSILYNLSKIITIQAKL